MKYNFRAGAKVGDGVSHDAHAGGVTVLGIVVARVGARVALVQVDFAVLVDGVRQVAADPQRPVVLAQRQASASARTIIHSLDIRSISVASRSSARKLTHARAWSRLPQGPK